MLRSGDFLEVAAGEDFRTVSKLSLFGSFFNDTGEIAFFASFTDSSSGIFVAGFADDPASTVIPLPASALLLGAAAIGLGALRRRRRAA